jgi:hypothetical protein
MFARQEHNVEVLGAVRRCNYEVHQTYLHALQPRSVSEREAVQRQFASRRGISPVSLACDGSHIPFLSPIRKEELPGVSQLQGVDLNPHGCFC